MALKDASRQVSFAADWWNARKLLADSPEAEREATTRAVAWLEEASALVAESKPPSIQEKPVVTFRRLMLGYPLHSRAARTMRVFYYISLLWMFYWTAGLPRALLGPRGGSEILKSNIVLAISGAVLALIFRLWEAIIEERVVDEKTRRFALRRALLFYPFHRPSARIVRIFFYIILLGILYVILNDLLDAAPSGARENLNRLADLPSMAFYAGCAVALRYWAASLEAGYKSGEASGVASSDPTVDEHRDDHQNTSDMRR